VKFLTGGSPLCKGSPRALQTAFCLEDKQIWCDSKADS
jgi:hypothetical protein